jgi:alginate O-acetyltransferase complex protein AlgI
VYYIIPRKGRNIFLFFINLLFYGWGEPMLVLLMVFNIAFNYLGGFLVDKFRHDQKKKKLFLILTCALDIGILAVFKYTGLIVDTVNLLPFLNIPTVEISLPIGISFYTFQTMSYTIDVYRGNVKAERNIIDFAAFVTLFPQLIAGPIVRYTDISRELKERRVNLDQISDGVSTFILGLGKKVLIANNIGALWTELSESVGFASLSTPLAWLGVAAFTLQIYFDFSGYSLMAIGLGRMMGFEFPQNFDFPYISKSFTEFWRRWHMTLGSWFREYLYFPLGGSRVSKPRLYFNLFVVWFCTGFWHGASWNFILWGLFFLVFLILEKTFLLPHLNRSRVLSHIYVLFFLLISWAIFAVTDFTQLGILLQRMFGIGVSAASAGDWVYYLRNYAVTFIVGILFSTPLPWNLWCKVRKHQAVNLIVLGGILLVSVAYLVDATYNPFLYFRF